MENEVSVIPEQKDGKALIPSLYALRAGLSVLSKEKDKIDETKRQISSCRNRIQQLKEQEQSAHKKNIAIAESKVTQHKAEIESVKNRIKSCQHNIDLAEGKYLKAPFIKWRNSFIKNILLILATSIILTVCILNAIHCFVSEKEPPFLSQLLLFLSLIIVPLVLTLLILFIYFIFRDYPALEYKQARKEYKFHNKNINVYKVQIETLRGNLAILEANNINICKIENDVKMKFDNFNKNRIEVQENNIKLYNEKLQEEQKIALELYKSFAAYFEPLLDKRDWGNTDLIIFCLETGRAESKKEALQLVDKQRQTDEIRNAIEEAGKEISLNIKEGLHSLRNEMMNCFNAISTSIDSLSDTTERANKALISQTIINNEKRLDAFKNINENLKSIASAKNMQNALQEKANYSSEKLLEEAMYIRNLALN